MKGWFREFAKFLLNVAVVTIAVFAGSLLVFPKEWGGAAALALAVMVVQNTIQTLADLRSLLMKNPKPVPPAPHPPISGEQIQINNGEGGRNVQAGTYIEHAEIFPPAPEEEPQPLLGSIPPLNAEAYIERGIEADVFAALRNGVAAVVGLHAPGGVGKSELAKRALQALKQEFDSVLWVDVGEKTASVLAPEMIARCGQRPPETYPAQVQTLQAIFSNHRYLVVLDDLRANAKDQLKDFLPPAPCCVLITSRIQQPSHLIPLKNL